MTTLTRRVLLGLVIAVTTTLAGADASAEPRQPGHERHCVGPRGFDLNEFHGTNHRIITDFCAVAYAGEHWISPAVWITNTSHEVIPAGYVPSRPTPIEDFNAKVVSARFVIDDGTGHARTYQFRAHEVLQTGLTFPTLDLPATAFIAVLEPLSIGTHTVDIYITLSADHWDGFDIDPAGDLVPAGETNWARVTFEVRPARERTD